MSKTEILAECYEEVCRRIEFAALLGVNLHLFVLCHTCRTNTKMTPNEALDHIEQHLREERKRGHTMGSSAA